MEITDILTPAAIVPDLKASSKKQALQELSRRVQDLLGLPERTVFDILMERERLGSTGIGSGIAIPHGKPMGIDRLCGIFARLERPIDFESIDEQPVDLSFLLLAPESAGADHLKALARVSRLLRDKVVCDKLRTADSADALFAVLTESPTIRAA